MSFTKDIAKVVAKACQQAFGVEVSPEISYTEPQFGDFTTNIAMQLAKELKSSPQEIAKKLIDHLKDSNITNVSVEGPGFINIKITPKAWQQNLDNMSSQGDNYGFSKPSTPRRLMVEYGQPNTHKLPHIGHLCSYITGDCIARILEASGEVVMRVNYQGDIGPHVARCLYVWRQRQRPRPDTLADKVQLLQECYQEGSALVESDPEAAQAIKDINKALYRGKPQEIIDDWQETKQWSLDFYRQLEASLHIKQAKYYLESQVWEAGEQIVRGNVGSIFEESDSAIIFPGEKEGLHDRVFITSEGTPTYETKDLGLSQLKDKDWPFDLSIITTAVEQNAYFEVVIKATEMALPSLKGKIKHIGFGMVNLTSGKMSSRTGNILSGPLLLEQLTQKAQKAVKDRGDLSKDEQSEIAHEVALGAIKYAFLRSNLGSNITFDPDKALSLQGESGPYLQYTHTRANSILNKAKKLAPISGDMDNQEIILVKLLSQFPEILRKAAENFAPGLVCHYLFGLSQEFNLFYEKNRIIGDPKEALRLQLTQVVATTLANGLDVLGITPLKRM